MADNNPSVFPMGEALTEQYSPYFTGLTFLQPFGDKYGPISNVTFSPGSHNDWHTHHANSGGGQVLFVTGGKGWLQILGEEARPLLPGDVVEIPANVQHWHGAAKDSWFAHLSMEVVGEGTYLEWNGPVNEDDYNKL